MSERLELTKRDSQCSHRRLGALLFVTVVGTIVMQACDVRPERMQNDEGSMHPY